MIETNQPESAFPSTFKSMSPSEGQVHRWGMTLRDYFAAKAMQSLILSLQGHDDEIPETAEDAYRFADAMIEARNAK
jgi:hypothetical protein